MSIRFNPCGGCCCSYDYPGWTVYHNNVSQGNHFYTLDVGYMNDGGYNSPNDGSGCYTCFGTNQLPLQFLFLTSTPNVFQTCQSVTGQFYARMELEETGISTTGTNPSNTWIRAAKIKSLHISGYPVSASLPGEAILAFDDTRQFYGFGNHFYGHNLSGCLTGISGTSEKTNLIFNITPYVAARVGSQYPSISGIFSVNGVSGTYTSYENVYHANGLFTSTVPNSGFYDGIACSIVSTSSTIIEDTFVSGTEIKQINTDIVVSRIQSFKYCLDFQPSGFCRTNSSYCDVTKSIRSTFYSTQRKLCFACPLEPAINTYYHTGDFYDIGYSSPNSGIIDFFPSGYLNSYTCDGSSYNSGFNFTLSEVRSFLSGNNLSSFDGYFYSGSGISTSPRTCRNYVPENPILAAASIFHYSVYGSGILQGPSYLLYCEYFSEITGNFGLWIYDNSLNGHCLNEIVKSDFYKTSAFPSSYSDFSCFSYTSVDESGNLVPPCYNDYSISIGNSPTWDMYQTNVPNSDLCTP